MAMEFDPYDKFAAFAGRPDRYRTCRPAQLETLKQEIAESFALLAERDGLASYREQALWTCWPDDWSDVAAMWRVGDGRAKVFMRTSFGDLFVWTGKSVWFIAVHELVATEMGHSIDWFLSTTITDPSFLSSMQLFEDTKRGREEAGPLDPNEMYLWSPALAMGGSHETSKLQRIGAVNAHSLLSQLGELKLLPY